MEFVLTKLKYICYMLCVLFIAALFSGCDPYAGSYPFLVESEWICNDPYMILTYYENSNGMLSATEYLTWNGVQLEVDLKFQANSYCISPEDSTDYDERLLRGTWEYRNGDLVLIIEEDFLFENQYAELVFSPVV